MSAIFQPQYWLLWSLILTVLLFFPIRKIIWVLSVRRAQRKIDEVDPQEQQRLRRRASVTAVLLSFLFSISYTGYLFGAGS